ncbi:MAG: DUF4209 domain-containing protein [Dehalococcoidia bacterium]|nr:DUF4209 domain-containing protein [Dehalococcoidia bacterium]
MNKKELEKLSPDELIALSESDTSSLRYDRYYLYQIAFDKYKTSGQSDKMENMRREICALQLSTHSKERRFSPLMTFKPEDGNEVGFPDLDKDIPDDAIEYYKERVTNTENPILKARYCDVIWEKKRDHVYGRNAINSYLSCWPLYFSNGWDRELVDSLTRALSISCMLNDQGLIDLSVQSHFEAIKTLANERRWRWVSDIIDSIINNATKYSEDIDYNYLLEVSELAIKEIAESEADSFHFQRTFLGIIANIRRIPKNDRELLQTKVRIAETYVEEGDWKKIHYPSGNLVAVSFYTSALKEYMNIGGFDSKVDELKMKITEANKTATNTELKPISVEIDIPTEPLKKHVEAYENKSIEEIYTIMSVDKNLLPSYETATKLAGELAKEFVLQHLMPLAIMKGNIQIKNVSGEQEKLEYQAIQNFQLSYRTISTRLIGMLFSAVETKAPNYLDDLAQYLTKSEIISGERLEIIKCGLRAYGNKEYVAAFLILIFQIEGILRDFLAKLRLPTFSYRKDKNEMRERQLDDILKTLSQVKGFDIDLGKFLEIFLCRIEADNYRNEAAHGLLKIDAFTKENCQLLLLSLIKLVPYSIVASEQGNQD